MAAQPAYARVVVDVPGEHLDHPFDYAVPGDAAVDVGQRVRVPFAGRRRTGWVVELADEPATDPARVKPIAAVQGTQRWFDRGDLALWRWVADRYAASLAAVLRHALPERVAGVEREAADWPPPAPPQPAARPPCPTKAWRPYPASELLQAAGGGAGAFLWRALPGDPRAAMLADLVARCLAAGRRALVLAPDPASPALAAALAVAGPHAADLRGDDRQRYRAFLRCRGGHAHVAVGERGAAFTPLPDLGLIVVDDEANPAYKEQRTPRFHAREVALARAWVAGAACVLATDVPSEQAVRHRDGGHLTPVLADRAVERDRAPRVEVVDRSDPRPDLRRTRLAGPSARALGEAVRAGGAAAVLAARRGQGTALACQRCGRRRCCPICDGSVAPGATGWSCGACGWGGAAFACPDCGAAPAETAPLAAGVARLAAELARAHPQAEVAAMEGFDATGPASRPAIAVLTRGSVVERPAWLGDEPAAAVVIPDADALLGRPAVAAAEDALRLWMRAARWTVDADGERVGRVLIETAEPRHPAVQALVRWDPEGFWRQERERRATLRYPPAGSLVRIAAPPGVVEEVRGELAAALPDGDELLGPDLDGALLVKTAALPATLAALTPLRHAWARADRKVRSDVDPVMLG